MKKILILLAALSLTMGSCDKEYLDPSAASDVQVLTNSNGLIAVCNALQARLATGGFLSVLYNTVAAGGLSTNELTVLNAGNIEELNISIGRGNVTNANGVVTNLWSQAQLVRANADLVLQNASNAADPGTRSGIIAYASIFRALALGTLAQYFQQAPIVTQINAPFVDRVQVLQSAVAQLEEAATRLTTTPVSADFTSKIVPGIDLANTIQALIARYSLMAGDYDKAIAAAGRVDLSKRSVFTFDELARNPLFETAFGNRNVFEPTDVNLGLTGALTPDPADQRIPFFVRANPTPTQNRGTGFYTANATSIPVYVPGEMLLIRAEAYARKNELTNAVRELNLVLIKTRTADVYGLGAELPAYSGPLTQEAILTEIYRNRLVELAFQGFRLEDSRRFNRPESERKRNFFPYPRVERENNAATPEDPAN
jgi:hypothetical protein